MIIASASYAQFNPYTNLIDPTAICRIDSLMPLRYEIRQGIKEERDGEGFMTVFEHEGPGVIQHIWTTVDKDDSLSTNTVWNLYIDGKLILRAPIIEFFSGKNGLMRPPFDTLYPGAFVCNVQIPFKKSVRLSSNPIGNPVSSYYAIAWKPLDESMIDSSFSLSETTRLGDMQRTAEQRFRSGEPLWTASTPTLMGAVTNVTRDNETTVFDTAGSGFITSLLLRAMSETPVAFDSVRLRIYWDNSPYPSVDAPLSDFFMNGVKNSTVKSFYIQCAPGQGFTSFFPMPFSKRVRITITNSTGTAFPLLLFVGYVPQKISIDTFGYFHAQFNESDPVPFGVLHPVIHEKGRGRFVGIAHTIPRVHHPSVIEGDPIIDIDSNQNNFIRYTGGEDYYNGGWWFFFREYTTPFAGHYNRFRSYYRMHVLDPLDFINSIDFNYQQGVNTDVEENVRTVAYYYKKWTRFWCDRDTLRFGESLKIGGSGYLPGETISVSIGGVEVSRFLADGNGDFDTSIFIPSGLKTGVTRLVINGEERPKPLYLISKAIIYPVSDYHPVILQYGDSLLVKGNGFIKGEKVSIYLDSIPLTVIDTTIVSAAHEFSVLVRMPNVADRTYRLFARGELTGEVLSEERVSITRNIDLEFEKLIGDATWHRGWLYRENLTYRWYDRWSKQSIARFEADSIGDTCSFQFAIPVSDTFRVKLLATTGSEYGDFSYSLDGKTMGAYNGYERPEEFWINVFPSDTMDLGTLYLPEGLHRFTFTCAGKDSNAERYFCGPDVLMLRPTTIMPLAPGTILDTITSHVSENYTYIEPYLYPNPVTTPSVAIGMTKDNTVPDSGASCTIRVCDITGKVQYFEKVPFHNSRAETVVRTDSWAAGGYYVQFTYSTAKETREFSRLLTVTK